MGRRMGGRKGACPVSEEKSERLVRLPFFNRLSEEDQGKVIQAIREFYV
jgi:dTDP-4-amino-4,6-dideoxygalactose transaminase